ncbi:hypothetical protein [Nocardioides convexus]|uniref:hypothetical protein n=1 Tax=Nocardioides convexus TaxID=2712224 RepID=UPI002418A929|nr:hypothetical protein [Nocardioides convexus]
MRERGSSPASHGESPAGGRHLDEPVLGEGEQQAAHLRHAEAGDPGDRLRGHRRGDGYGVQDLPGARRQAVAGLLGSARLGREVGARDPDQAQGSPPAR